MNGNSRTLIDTNILVYANDNSEPAKQDICRKLIDEKTLSGQCFLSAQNLGEFYWTVTRKTEILLPAETAKYAIHFFCKVFQISHYSAETVKEAVNFCVSHRLQFWDALIAATMLENSISIIYTENVKDFSKIPGITAINPFKSVK